MLGPLTSCCTTSLITKARLIFRLRPLGTRLLEIETGTRNNMGRFIAGLPDDHMIQKRNLK
jgi:hypothetical protein